MTTHDINRLTALVGLTLVGLVLWAFVVEIKGVFEALAVEGWPSVQGKITESKARRGCDHGSRNLAGSYYPMVFYTYEYGGKTYSSARIAFGLTACGGESRAQEIASAYPVGAQVTVWVNPEAPSEASLVVPDGRGRAWVLVLLAPVFLVGSIWLARAFKHDKGTA